MKIFVATFSRSSDGALSKLISKMKDADIYTDDYDECDIVLVPGDREETFDFALKSYRHNKRIIHLWAGEANTWETHDDVYRHAITLMSDIQLCANDIAKRRVKALCKSVGKIYDVATVGNIFLDNMDDIDESLVPKVPYDLILYNPPSRLSSEEIKAECEEICDIRFKNSLWLEPNGDKGSDIVRDYINLHTIPRPKFLGLLKNCGRFITNSSCQYYEAPFLLEPEQIIPIGKRNRNRDSKNADVKIKGASDKIMRLLENLI